MQDIDAFVDHQRQTGRSPATVKRRVAALKTFFDFLAEETGELAWPNPVRFKRHAGKQPQALPRDLSEAEVERLWAVVASARDRAWLVLLWRAGLRVGEVVSLTTADVLSPPSGVQPARVRVCGKGRKERVVLLSADAYAVLAVWLAQRPSDAPAALFVNARGQPLSVSGVAWQLRRYGQQAGVTVSPHRLRHTFARQVTEAGMPLAVGANGADDLRGSVARNRRCDPVPIGQLSRFDDELGKLARRAASADAARDTLLNELRHVSNGR